MRNISGLALFAILSAFVPTVSQAAFVSDFTGNSGFATNSKGIGGWVNFAVYANPNGSNWVTDLFGAATLVTGSSTTGFERNVFFYEVVRNGTATGQDLISVTIPQGRDLWTGIGAFTDRVFSSGGAVVSGTNPTIGPSAAAGVTDVTGSLDGTPFATSAAAVEPNGTIVFPAFSIDGTSGDATFSFVFTDVLDHNEYSSILFLTSNSNPLTPRFLAGGSAAASGAVGSPGFNVPVSNPEPGSLVLLSFAGISGVGLAWRRRRKEKKQRDGGNASVSIA